jgi:hypothetical protein
MGRKCSTCRRPEKYLAPLGSRNNSRLGERRNAPDEPLAARRIN